MGRAVWVVSGVALAAQAVAAGVVMAGPHDEMITRHATRHGVPETLVRRVIHIESKGNERAVHAGNYGLMQIRLGTAKGLGYTGDANGLLDPDVNLTYAVKYLAGAYRAAGCDHHRAIAFYQKGYYGVARRDCVEKPGAEPTIEPALLQVADASDKESGKPAGRKSRSTERAPEPKFVEVIKPKAVRAETVRTETSGSAPIWEIASAPNATREFAPVRATTTTTPPGVVSGPTTSGVAPPAVAASKGDRLAVARSEAAAAAVVPVPLSRPAALDRMASAPAATATPVLIAPEPAPVAAAKPEKKSEAKPAVAAKPARARAEKTKRVVKRGRMVAATGAESEAKPAPDAVGTFLNKIAQQTKSLLPPALTGQASAR